MSNLDTQSTVTLIINGQQSLTSLRDVTSAVNATRAALSRMREEDNPQLYRERINQLGRLTEAQRAMREEINSGAEAARGFFADFGEGFREIEEMAGRITAGVLIYKAVSFAIEGIRDLFNGAVEAYDEAQRSQTQLQQVLRSTGGVAGETREKLEKYQQTLMDQTGIDDDVIAKGEEMLLTFTNIRGKIYEQALPAIIDMTAAMNGGKVSMEGIQATAIQVGKALNDPINGATALKKVGVTLDDQQKQQIKTMQEANNMMGAQAVILKELQKEFGGTAAAIANTDIGKLQAFETALGNLKEKIGSFITAGKASWAEAWTPLISALADTRDEATRLTDAFNEQQTKVQGLEKNTTPLIARYDELKGKSSLTKDEQVELHKVIQQLATDIPIAVTEWDKYGNALGINTDKARDFLKVQQNMLKVQNEDAINKQIEMINEMSGQRWQLTQQLNQIEKSGHVLAQGNRAWRMATNEDIQKIVESLKEVNAEIDKRRDAVKGLSGENIDGPGPANPTSGPSAAEQDAAKRKLEQFKKLLASVREETDKLAENSKQGTLDDLDAKLKVIQDKYQKVVEQIKQLMKDPHTNDAIRQQLNAMTAQLTSSEAGEETKTKAAFAKAQREKEKKERDEELKAATARIDDVYSEAESNLGEQQNQALGNVKADGPKSEEAQRYAIQQLYAKKGFELQKQHFEDLKLINQAYGKDTGKIDKQIAEATIKENDRAAKEKIKQDTEYKAAKKTLQDFELNTAQAGAQALMGVLNKNSFAYKAALVVEQGIAAARVVINTEASIAAYAASVAALGPLGLPLLAEYTVMAHISEGISLATIAAQVIKGVTASGAKAATGGLIPAGPSHSEGGISLFNNKTGQHIAEMEGGEPIMILSKQTRANNGNLINQLLFNSMYRNGAQVDVGRISQGIRMEKGGMLPIGAESSTVNHNYNQASSFDISQLVKEMQLTRKAIQDQQIVFNTTTFDEYNRKLKIISDKATS